MKLEELKEGMKRILDAANEKLNNLCEEVGIEPDDPVLTDEDEEDSDNEGDDGSVDGKTDGDSSTSDSGDGNTMPIPSDLEGGAAGGVQPYTTVIPPEAQQVDAGAANAPIEGQAAANEPLPDENEDEMKKAAANAQHQAQ